MSAELPKMLEPTYIYHPSDVYGEDDLFEFAKSGDVACPDCINLYTATQMREYAQEAARQAMERRWISVEERLPPPFEDVLIYPRPTDYCCEGQADMKGQWTYSDYEPYNGDVKHRINPTHWMPLPPPPASGKGEQ